MMNAAPSAFVVNNMKFRLPPDERNAVMPQTRTTKALVSASSANTSWGLCWPLLALLLWKQCALAKGCPSVCNHHNGSVVGLLSRGLKIATRSHRVETTVASTCPPVHPSSIMKSGWTTAGNCPGFYCFVDWRCTPDRVLRVRKRGWSEPMWLQGCWLGLS